MGTKPTVELIALESPPTSLIGISALLSLNPDLSKGPPNDIGEGNRIRELAPEPRPNANGPPAQGTEKFSK